jgi:hypothetical protein
LARHIGLEIISGQLMALLNGNMDLIYSSVQENPSKIYNTASDIVKEFIHQEKAKKIINKSVMLLLEDVETINSRAKENLPVFVAGGLADLYRMFFPKGKLIDREEQQSDVLLRYAVNYLERLIKST